MADQRLDWRSEAGLKIIMERATAFSKRDLHVKESDAFSVAAEAVGGVWEDVKCGREFVQDSADFQRLVSERAYKIAKSYKFGPKEISLDAPLSKDADDGATLKDVKGTARATQINEVYLSELRRGFARLPDKLSIVMLLLSKGYNADDIAKELHIPIHRVFQRIGDARRALFFCDLIGMSND